MIQIKKTMNRKIDSSVAHLITEYGLLMTAALLPAALLTGCMGIYEGGFECPAGTGVGCKSISEVNEMVERGVLPQDSSASTAQGAEYHSESTTTKCESCGRPFPSHQEKPSIWINPLYLKGSSSEMQTLNEETKKNFIIESPHQHIRKEIEQQKGLHDTISL